MFLLTLAFVSSFVPQAAPPAAIEPCARPAIAGRVECGTIRVPENRARPAARALSIFFVVVRATGDATDEPVFFFTGGPGSAASMAAGALSTQLASLRDTRDLVFIDQRGTGRSAPLSCSVDEDPVRRLRPMFDPAAMARCRDTLARNADLRYYTTSDAVLDVEDVRRALGYERINVHGSSYGTRAAWAYAARFPERVRSMTLHGPAPPGFHLPVPFARGLDAAIDGVVAACEADDACAARFPSLAADVTKAFEQLRAEPAPVTVRDRQGVEHAALLTRGELAEAVRYLLYTVGGAANLPLFLSRAADGDYSLIAQASIDNRRRLEEQLNRGMFMSVTCAEDVPFMDEASVRNSSRGTRLGDYRVRQQMAACKGWPRGAGNWWRGPAGEKTSGSEKAAGNGKASANGKAAADDKPGPVDTPTLVLVGEFDPATPAEWARRAMSLLPNGRLVVIPHGGHSFDRLGLGECVSRVTSDFIERGTPKGVETGCIALAKRPPFRVQ